VTPMTNILLNRSGARRATESMRSVSATNAASTRNDNTNPSSSAMTANTESPATSGRYRYFCRECPRPSPNGPPEPMARNAWLMWYPMPRGSSSGRRNVMKRAVRYGADEIRSASAPSPVTATVARCASRAPAAKYIASAMPATVTMPPSSGCSMMSRPAAPSAARNGRTPRFRSRVPSSPMRAKNDAKNSAIISLAGSIGWNEKSPMWIQLFDVPQSAARPGINTKTSSAYVAPRKNHSNRCSFRQSNFPARKKSNAPGRMPNSSCRFRYQYASPNF
ncbi:MAG: hypothetical protein US34_C0007G0057, partial [Candidatus Nomurabacteria bacterium GW2011_GWC2_36_9]